MNEFRLIDQFLALQTVHRKEVVLGPGDDCALVEVPAGQQVAITTDTLVAGVHFPVSTSPFDIGYKALAVNLSDLAAMGATPAWVTLAVTLPGDLGFCAKDREAEYSNSVAYAPGSVGKVGGGGLDRETDNSNLGADASGSDCRELGGDLKKNRENWIAEFSRGIFALATQHNLELIGGDLTRGPLSITVQAQGLVPKGFAITRSGAKSGDLIYVTNTIGDAGLGLLFLNNKISVDTLYQERILARLNRPEPRVLVGEKLRGIASACIDISDGLAGDLGHILERSDKGAVVFIERLPLSDALKKSLSAEQAISLALTGGDDYELCFTVPVEKRDELENILAGISFTCIGEINDSRVLEWRMENGTPYQLMERGYLHFE